MGDQFEDQDVRDSESEEVRGRAVNEDVNVDDVTDDQDEEDIDDEEDSTF